MPCSLKNPKRNLVSVLKEEVVAGEAERAKQFEIWKAKDNEKKALRLRDLRKRFDEGVFDAKLRKEARAGFRKVYLGCSGEFQDELAKWFTEERGLTVEKLNKYDEEGRSQYGLYISGW